LPGSRMGPGDHKVHEGQERICLTKARDKHDMIFVEEKWDGTCVAVAMLNVGLIPLGRSGYRAVDSPYEQHRMFDAWVWMNEDRFRTVLREGERLCGEWLAQAHGTRYRLDGLDPFKPFDLMIGANRTSRLEFSDRIKCAGFQPPKIVHTGGPFGIDDAMRLVHESQTGIAVDDPEGAVWRVERKGVPDFLAKFVRPDKVDGCYLPEVSGQEAIWNWKP